MLDHFVQPLDTAKPVSVSEGLSFICTGCWSCRNLEGTRRPEERHRLLNVHSSSPNPSQSHLKTSQGQLAKHISSNESLTVPCRLIARHSSSVIAGHVLSHWLAVPEEPDLPILPQKSMQKLRDRPHENCSVEVVYLLHKSPHLRSRDLFVCDEKQISWWNRIGSAKIFRLGADKWHCLFDERLTK